MENLSSVSIQDLTPEQASTCQAKVQEEWNTIIQGIKKDKADMPDLAQNIKLTDTTPTFYKGKLSVAFAFGAVYAVVKTMPPLYMNVEGAELTFEADGVAFGAGFGGAALVGSSIYTAKEIAAFGQVHIHLTVISLYTKINMWTTDMYPIGVWFGPNIGEPVGGGTFGANCAITQKGS